MKVFKDSEKALKSLEEKKGFYLNSLCPYTSEEALCGSWCALFYLEPEVDNMHKKTSAHVILGCKAGEKLLYVSEIVEE